MFVSNNKMLYKNFRSSLLKGAPCKLCWGEVLKTFKLSVVRNKSDCCKESSEALKHDNESYERDSAARY